MGSNWKTRKLEDIAQVVDSRHKTPQYSEDGYPMVRVVDVKGGILQLNGTKKVNDEVYSDFSKGRDPEIGDLIISRVGSYGNVAYVNSLDKFCLGQNTALIIPNDKSRFLYYTLISPQVKAQIEQMVVGAVQKTISLKTIKNLDIPEPPKDIKESISKALGAIDDKIELNNQTSQTLEKMAQTLFKSWFVDFDPVFDNALAKADFNLANLPSAWPSALLQRATSRLQVLQDNPALQAKLAQPSLAEAQANTALEQTSPTENTHQHFPSEFECTDEPSIGINGWIPKGWCVSKLSDLINVKHGFAYKGEFFSDEQTKHILLTPGNVSVGGGFKSAKYKYYSGPIVDEYIFKEGDVYLNMTDLSKASDTLGYPAVVPKINGITFHHNQRLGKVIYREHKSAQKEFIYQILCSDKSRNNVLASATGTTVKHTSPTKILSLSICSSGGDIELLFETYANSIYKKISENNLNNIELTKLRDTLLPKLISGEIQIPDLEAVNA